MASALRRRRAIASDTGSESPTPRDDSVAPDRPEEPGTEEKIKVAHHHKKTRKRRTTAIFLLGSLFGIVIAGFFASSNDLINLPDIGELSMDSLLDVLPAGLVKDMRDLVVSLAAFDWLPWHSGYIALVPRLTRGYCRRANEIS